MRLVEVSSRQNMGQGSGQVQEPLKEGDYSLMFRVRLTGCAPSWGPPGHLAFYPQQGHASTDDPTDAHAPLVGRRGDHARCE